MGAACIAAVAVGLVAAPAANADFGVARWEAGTCRKGASECTYASDPSRFYTTAAGHPEEGLTDFEFALNGLGLPEGQGVKDVRVDLPEGLNVDPQAVPQCPQQTFEENESQCAASQVGVSEVTALKLLELIPVKLSLPVYDLVPEQGEPALFAFAIPLLSAPQKFVFLHTEVAWDGDYHEGFTIRDIPNSLPLRENRLVFDGTKGGTFLTLPSPCHGPTTTGLHVDSYEYPGEFLGYETTPPAVVGECQSVPFAPTVEASAGGAPTDSPAEVAVSLNVPQKLQPQNSSTVKSAQVTLPAGAGLNPATAPGLEFCPDAGFPLKSKAPVTCPAASRIGSVEIETPVLPAHSLSGPVYLASQQSRDPSSGNEYRIFFDAESARYGVQVRLEGKVAADPATGQLTATFDGAPQVAFSSVTLRFGTAGHVAPLTSPPVCASSASSRIVPWSTGEAVSTPPADLVLSSAPGGAPCAKAMAERPFAPSFSARPDSLAALAYTPYRLQLGRNDGEQEIKGMDLTLPPGATAKLAGLSYCPEGALAAAAADSGAAERQAPSCPADSHVGVATIAAGTGSSPLRIEGQVYLAGPDAGAPLSLAILTPALAGPFDLGTVAVRVPLFVDPETAQIRAATDAIPDVFGGAKLDLRSISVALDRREFTLNGTSCAAASTTGTIAGGGGDPANPAAFSAFAVSSPVQPTGCGALKFKPRLSLRLFGATGRAKHPRLRAELKTRPGDANVGRASVALPHALFLDQASLSQVCTRVQFAAEECPKGSIYGHARAVTPLLDKPLEGPVYLRSAPSGLPDLVAHLQGQIDIDLVDRIDSYKGGIRTTFDRVPDVPVTSFVLTLPGGKHGLLVASRNLCQRKVVGLVQLKGQDGDSANGHQTIHAPCQKSDSRGQP